MARPEASAQEFKAKVLSILPEIKREKDPKKRVRGQDKWGFLLQILTGPRKGETMALWGHWRKSRDKARIGNVKLGDKLMITIRGREWSWKKAK